MAILYPEAPGLEEMAARRLRRMRLTLVGLAGLVAGALIVGLALAPDDPTADPGSITEPLYEWTGPVPSFTDVTTAWGLADWRNTARTEASGGLAIGDVDGDGNADLIVAGGSAVLFLGGPEGFRPVDAPLAGDAVSTDLADVDGDGRLDILLGRERGPDLIIWGDALLAGERSVTELDGGEPSTGLVAADLDDDARVDILRLGYGGGRAAPDVIWRQVGLRSFLMEELPNSRRRSYAAAIADLDGFEGLDIWVTRDVGWKSGGDSLYVRSRSGGREWLDRAPVYGTDMEIDGMGVTLADLTGDEQIDVYLSDLGDNELLRRSRLFLKPEGINYQRDEERGIGRIRPPESDPDTVSSSWGSGIADLNLDGYLDLVVVNGGFPSRTVDNKIEGTTVAASDPPSVFLGLGGGFLRWADVWPELGIAWEGAGRGLALGDLDGDLDTDIVISTRDAGLRVLRNDAVGSSISLTLERSCDPTGVFVNAFTDTFPLRLPVAAPTFLGRHAAEFILGTMGDAVFLPSGDLSRGPARYAFDGSGREALELTCEDVGRRTLR